MTQKEKELELITPNFRYEPIFEFYENDIETIKRLQVESGDFDFTCLTE